MSIVASKMNNISNDQGAMKMIATRNNFTFAPSTLSEAMNYATMISGSSFCPSSMKGKPGDVLIAIQMGAEIGLSPLQALQNIAVISGKPCVYGDAALAVVMSSSQYVSHREWFEGSIADGTRKAFCAIVRKNSEEYIKSFSMDDAKKASLWSKQGVWQQYPDRMLQMRARSFCIRDKFADALRGLNIREEVEDYSSRKTFSSPIPVAVEEVAPVMTENRDPIRVDDMILEMSQSLTLDALEETYRRQYRICATARDREALERIITEKDRIKQDILRRNSDDIRNFVCEMDSVHTGEIRE